ncbi:MAG: 2-C-methyl-D-erythritol 4-phosphate cytidylyltransferase [Deltaproteobacteria bacterium]|nr:2-C-methyl-D-erythritol 4-phosphate cytidylyltransferase [Deltaproteobacteria bacterium]
MLKGAVRCQALIVAAGQGSRFGAACPKQLLPLAGRPLLIWALDAFRRSQHVHGAVLVVSDEAREEIQRLLVQYEMLDGVTLALGGAERADSVQHGLAALDDSAELVAVHDAARALTSPELIDRVVAAARQTGAAIAALPARDTVKRASKSGFVAQTLDRDQIWLAQTPQVGRVGWLRQALATWRGHESNQGTSPTDEAQLLEFSGHAVQLVEGNVENFKITVPQDLALAEALLSSQAVDPSRLDPSRLDPSRLDPSRLDPQAPRVGIGHDVHRLVEGRELILGGVHVPFERGLEGHSDADVLAHAIGDALLGAAALGDLGQHFPPTDARFAGADSLGLLSEILQLVQQAGFAPQSIDSVVICERPRLAPFIPEMRERLANALNMETSQVSVKATTTEGLGFTGRGEGITAQATAVIR